MDNDKVKVLDGGYGLIGNLNIHRILLDLPHENRMQYEKQLEKAKTKLANYISGRTPFIIFSQHNLPHR